MEAGGQLQWTHQTCEVDSVSYLQLRTYSPAAKLAGISTLSTISRLFGPSNHTIVQSQAISQISEAIVQSQTISQISEGDILARSVAVGGWVASVLTRAGAKTCLRRGFTCHMSTV